MVDATELWFCLERVRFLKFVACGRDNTGWNGNGSGTVAVTAPSETVLTFTESGRWQPLGGQQTRFSNVYRWSLLGPESIRLEHLRFGADRPVFLFDLAPRSDGNWASIKPHVCREDCYSAELRLLDWGLGLSWAVTGPRKQERIDYEYRWENVRDNP